MNKFLWLCIPLKAGRYTPVFLSGMVAGTMSMAQPWMDNLKSKQQNFYDIQKSFNEYWKNKPIERGKGWKPFKRWEWFMEPRVFPSGDLPDPMLLYNEWQKQKKFSSSNPSAKKAGNWTPIGPVQVPSGGGAGRVNCIRFDPANTNTIWAGAPAGGLWKSTDGGNTWALSNTDLLSSIGVSDVAIDPYNTSVMYIATGDGDAGDTYAVGVLKSTDGGATWNTSGLNWSQNQLRTIHRLIIHPTNTDTLLTATSNGIYRTLNGGSSWTQVRSGEHLDIEYHPSNSSIVYACMASQVAKSTDGGGTWTTLAGGLPTSGVGRIAIAVTPANTSVIYALCAKSTDYGYYGLYKSADEGATWTQQSATPNIFGYQSNGSDAGGQAWYDMALAVSPTSASTVFAGGVNIWKSTTSGTSWTISAHWTGSGAPYVHADIHDLVFQPGSGSVVYSGNDGGVFKTTTTGTSWSDKSDGLAIHQIYRLGTSATNANLDIVGAQDNGTSAYSTGAWTNVLGGDGMECIIDYSNANTMYGSLYNGYIYKSTNGGGNFSDISPSAAGNGAWVTPYVMHPTNNQILFAGFQDVYKTTTGGSSWSTISSGLTSSTLKSIAVAPSDPNTIYVATSSTVWKTTTGGAPWTNITGTLPSSVSKTYIAVHATNPQILWVTFSGYSVSNKVYKSTNGGATWTNFSTGMPSIPVNCIVFEDNGYDALYVGTDLGVYYINNTLSSWVSFNDGLPKVPVNELEINSASNKIRAATFGRGLWESDLNTVATVTYDAGIISIISPTGTVCDSATITPVVRLQNMGITTLTSVTINYTIDAVNYSYSWSGSLTTGSQQDVSLPAVTLADGNHSIQVNTSNPNGNTDGNTGNDASSGIFVTGTSGGSNITIYPYTTGFETACDVWTHNVTGISNGNVNPNPTDIWELGVPGGTLLNTAHGGTNVYGTNLTGNYDYSSYARLVSPTMNFTNMISPKVQFWMAYDLEFQWDALYFEYSVNGGGTWTKLGVSTDPNWYNDGSTAGGNPPGSLMTGSQWTGTNSTWTLYSHSLSSLAGQSSVMLRFNVASDEYVEQEGVVADDFKVWDTAVGMDELEVNPVHIYMNYTDRNLYIDFAEPLMEAGAITLWSITGQKIETKKFDSGMKHFKMNVSGYNDGLYFVEIRTGERGMWGKVNMISK